MFSPLIEAMIVNAVVLVTVLATDLGPARKIGAMRLLRPVIAAAVIIPLFVASPATHGTGLLVEIAGAGAGLIGGLAYRSPRTGKPVSSTGWPYAAFWTVTVAARAAFTYGAAHWFSSSIASWAIASQVSAAAITDGMIFMAIALILIRTAGLLVLAARLPEDTQAQALDLPAAKYASHAGGQPA
jgi:hypothetical protein